MPVSKTRIITQARRAWRAWASLLLLAAAETAPSTAHAGPAIIGGWIRCALAYAGLAGRASELALPPLKTVPKYPTTPMSFSFHLIDNFPLAWVDYYYGQSREQFRVFVRDGTLWDARGNLLDTNNKTSWNGIQFPSYYLFVMDDAGNFYVAPGGDGFLHSSFLGGRPVAAAGRISVSQGRLVIIDRSSGHYEPSREALENAVSELEQDGLHVDPLTVRWSGIKDTFY